MAGEKNIENIKKDFSFLGRKVLAVLLYGSLQRSEHTERSDIDICIVAPGKKPNDVLKEVFRSIDVHRKKYDVYIFEELPMYIKAEIIRNHTVIVGNKPDLYEYFYFVNKLWEDQKHRQHVSKEDILRVLS